MTADALSREKERQAERKQLSQTGEWLYSARSIEELLMVIKTSLNTLIPEASGELFLYSNSRNVLDLETHWGDVSGIGQIDAEDCWALRRGRAYPYGAQDIQFPCSHVSTDDGEHPYFCLPIIAHGQTIGLLHLNFHNHALLKGNAMPPDYEAFFIQRWELALLCAEQISLAVANVRLRQELEDQSVRDPLTDLWNRRWLLEAAHKEVMRYRSDGVPLSIISLDLDHFKKFNDHHGHDAGDLVLRAIGAQMKEIFTDDCAPCRIGGEEFIVLCAGYTLDAAQKLAEVFRQSVTKLSVRYSGAVLPSITVSAGVSTMGDPNQQVVDLMKVADRALYAAKRNGRNTVQTQNYLPDEAHDALAARRIQSQAITATALRPKEI
jgi:diguanylate cyclase (GGDEF)-like protein